MGLGGQDLLEASMSLTVSSASCVLSQAFWSTAAVIVIVIFILCETSKALRALKTLASLERRLTTAVNVVPRLLADVSRGKKNSI